MGSSSCPLLGKKEEEEISSGGVSSQLKSSAKWSLKVTMWAIFVAWAAFIFLYPTDFTQEWYSKWLKASRYTLFGVTGSVFLVFGGPIFLIVILAVVYLLISGDEDETHEKKKISKNPRFRLWTFPVLVDGPFGVVNAGEIIGIVLFVVFIVYAFGVYTKSNFDLLPLFDVSTSLRKSALMVELTGLRLGILGMICLAFLFLPVARGSVLLRLIDIPFEHATRYHVWLGHLTMALFSLHGLFYVIGWAMQGKLVHELLEWKNEGIANLPGVISLVAGLFMWVTSLPGLRRINFELFFYTHQLYVIFVVFFALHVGDFVFSITAAGIFLFMLDRFLRFWQSRRTVDVISATCFPCGTLELVISKPANLNYNALGWCFLQIRELSWLQWHPFSVSSSPLDGKYHMAFLIKVLGGWTAKLKQQISSIQEDESQTGLLFKPDSKITASVEGPYGHESPYHLEYILFLLCDIDEHDKFCTFFSQGIVCSVNRYENLILVAGGIGISPFLAILSDVLHRLRDGKPCLPKNILIVWAIKKSDELPLLQTVDMESICPSFSDVLNLEIQTYVTRESEPPLEEGIVHKYTTTPSPVIPVSKGTGMSVLVGTGSVLWAGLYVVVSIIGLVISLALLNIFYINPFNITSWWYKGLLFVGCMAASVVVFGGAVIGLWHLWGMRTSTKESEDSEKATAIQEIRHIADDKAAGQEQYVSRILYGQRPNFGEIFGTMSERWGNVDIGVLLCGPSPLQTSVAKECRTQNLKRRSNQPIFHFNSHSFDL